MPRQRSDKDSPKLIDRGTWNVAKPGERGQTVLALIYMDERKLARLVTLAAHNKHRKAVGGPIMVLVP